MLLVAMMEHHDNVLARLNVIIPVLMNGVTYQKWAHEGVVQVLLNYMALDSTAYDLAPVYSTVFI